MTDIAIDYCYCSVFDECYVGRHDSVRPEPVKECKAPDVTFRPNFRKR